MKLSAEDSALVDSLKAKYAPLVATNAQSDPSVSDEARYIYTLVPSSASVGTGNGKQFDVDVKLCTMCQGSGLVVEEYNHRRLERFCTTCEGKGAKVYRGGKEVLEAPRPQQERRHEEPELPQTIPERIRKLEADIATLDEKLAGYQREKAQAGAAKGQDAEEDRLRGELCKQIDLQIARLTKIRANKQSSLQLLQTEETK